MTISAGKSATVAKLLNFLNRFNEVAVSLSDTSEDGQTITIILDFRPRVKTIEKKAKFADKLAKLLGHSQNYEAFASNVGINWIGNKGVNRENEPFLVLEIPIDGIESITDTIVRHSAEFIRSPRCRVKSKSFVSA